MLSRFVRQSGSVATDSRKPLLFIRHLRFARFCTLLRSPAQKFVDFRHEIDAYAKMRFSAKSVE
jgi:hypothetical protein